MITIQKGASFLYTDAHELVGVIHKNEKTHDNVFYSCKKMTLEQIERLLGSDVVGKGGSGHEGKGGSGCDGSKED